LKKATSIVNIVAYLLRILQH